MVTQGLQFTPQVIETKGQDGQGPVAFVTLFLDHGCPPKIIGPQVA